MVRCGYTYQDGVAKDIYDATQSKTNFSNGFTAGASVNAPLVKAKGNKKAVDLAVDYAYRSTAILKGIHSIGIRLTL